MRYRNLLKNLSNWWLYLAVKFGFRRDDPLTFRTRSGVVVEVPRRLLQTFKEIFMAECYCRGMNLPAVEKPVVIDISANAGYFTLFALSRMPGARTFSYEPIPANFNQLKRNLDLNPGQSARAFQMAVAGQPGTLTLAYDPSDAFTTSATVNAQANAATIQVACTSLAEIFRGHKLDYCDLLKMDCEGAEYDILYNCPADVLTRIRQIAMEVHGGTKPEHNIDSLEAYLRQNGFETQRRPVGMLWADQSSLRRSR
jgi:FkbM family methyltransferase